MADISLTPTSYLVLGIVRDMEIATPYEMKQFIAYSVGNFWSFPHSQLYAEPARLAEAGLLDEEQEPAGRRRKRYRITTAGVEALGAWVGDPASEGAEMRDTALLQLFFSTTAAEARSVAEAQIAIHQAQLDVYHQTRHEAAGGARASQLATLEMGMRYEQTAIDFWASIASDPPGV